MKTIIYTLVILALSGCRYLPDLKDKLPDIPGIPAPDKPTPQTGADAIDATKIRYLHANVSGWPITSQLAVSFSGGNVNMPYDKAKVWPHGKTATDGGSCNANPWIIVNIDGQWTAATFEWLRIGQTSKPMKTVAGDHIKVGPLGGNWRPTSGTEYGWMVSSVARDKNRTVNERTNIVMARWP